jgi:diguanylate cyclase (GGDEF)-like protein
MGIKSPSGSADRTRGRLANLISLRKHIDSYQDPVALSAVAAFRASLLAMAENGQRAIPPLGEELNRRLIEIEGGLAKPGPDYLDTAAREVESELSAWASRALRHHSENERDTREIIAALARAAESVVARDEKYAQQIGGLSARLRNIASLNDLSAIRRSIVESAAALQTCVEKMAEESRQSVVELSAQVAQYKEKLAISEKLSTLDTLTELANRRAFDGQLQARIRLGRPFGLVVIDLNGFKAVNDTHGHLAGDDLLRQFSQELRAHLAATDFAARWGGDEFAVLVAGNLEQTLERVERIRRWAFGEYKVRSGETTVRISLNGSVGAAEWNGVESASDLIARADALVYSTKQTRA